MELPEYRKNVALLTNLTVDASEVQAKLQSVTNKIAAMLHPQHPFLVFLRSDQRYFDEYVNMALPWNIQNAIEECPPEYLRDKYQGLYYDLTVFKPYAFFNQVENFVQKCGQVLEKEFEKLDKYRKDNQRGLSSELEGLKGRSEKLKRQLVNLKEAREQFMAVKNRVLPDPDNLMEIILVIHRNLKMYRFKMTRATTKSELERYLRRELVNKNFFKTKAEAPILGVDDKGKMTGWAERLLSPSALEPRKIIPRNVVMPPKVPGPGLKPRQKKVAGPLFKKK